MIRGLVAAARLLGLIALLKISLCTAEAQSTAELLSRLDRAARSFAAATANIRIITHTGVIDKDDTQAGTVAVKKVSQKDMRFLINFTGEDAQEIALHGRTLQIYYPKLNTIREYDIGKYKDLAQKLILLGFGMAGHELAENYEISNLGTEPC